MVHVLLVIIVAASIVGMAVTAYLECREWNGGIDRKSGKPWRLAFLDSQGGRCYEADGTTIYVSYPFVDGMWR